MGTFVIVLAIVVFGYIFISKLANSLYMSEQFSKMIDQKYNYDLPDQETSQESQEIKKSGNQGKIDTDTDTDID